MNYVGKVMTEIKMYSCFSRVLGPFFLFFFRVLLKPVFQSPRSRFSGFLRVQLGSWFSSFFRVSGPGFPVFLRSFQDPNKIPGPSFLVFLGSCQGLIRVPCLEFLVFVGSWVPVFMGSREGPTRVLVFQFLQVPLRSHQDPGSGFFRVLLGSLVPVFWYAVYLIKMSSICICCAFLMI